MRENYKPHPKPGQTSEPNLAAAVNLPRSRTYLVVVPAAPRTTRNPVYAGAGSCDARESVG